MFTLFSLIKSYPIPQAHSKMMLWYLDKYANTDAGRWLKTVRYRDMTFWYCYGMSADILGAFLSLFKKHIFLKP